MDMTQNKIIWDLCKKCLKINITKKNNNIIK